MRAAALILILFSTIALAEGEVDWVYSHRTPGTPANDRNVGNEILYQIVVDRFHQGLRRPQPYNGTFSDPERKNWQAFWGGDLQGIIDKLPYLSELGPTRIWLTPIHEPQMTRVSDARGNLYGPYHGYWVRDLFRLNPFFTRRGEKDYGIVKELVEAGKKLGIGTYLDAVMNHSSPEVHTAESQQWLDANKPLPNPRPARGPKPQPDPGALQGGVITRNGRYVIDFKEDERRMKADPNYKPMFNHNPGIQNYDDTHQMENWSLVGLADYNIWTPGMKKLLFDYFDFWIAKTGGLAGFRIDAIPNVPLEFWTDLTDYLKRKHPKLELVGEIFARGSGDKETIRTFEKTSMSTFDFRFRYALEKSLLKNESFRAVTDVWTADATLGDARPLYTFIDNHDVARLRSMGLSGDKMKQALGLMFASRGIPTIYYGLEQDLYHEGGEGDAYNRPMMKSFDTNSDFFKLTQQLIAVRKSNEAFRYGDTHVVHVSDHILAFERRYGNQKAFFMTSKNPRVGADVFDVRNLSLADGDYRDALSGKTYTVKGGVMNVSIGHGEMILLTTHPPAPKGSGGGCEGGMRQVAGRGQNANGT